jgi:hypothetical protein
MQRKEYIFVSLFTLLFLGGAGAFYLMVERESPPLLSEGEERIAFQEEPGQSQREKEEVIEQAKGAIFLARQTILMAEQFLEKRELGRRDAEKLQDTKREPATTFAKTEEGRAENAKGIYMTGLVATGNSLSAVAKRQGLVDLILKTELNAIVIDVKEAGGSYLLSRYYDFVNELRQRGIWTIARIVVFADATFVDEHPDWYCKTKSGAIWQDLSKRYWLDPGNEEVQEYLISFSKKVIDGGFQELQFDYIRFPADGDLDDLICPASLGKNNSEIIGNFVQKLSRELREYKPDIVLSADLFGLLAVRGELSIIGQRVSDFAKTFDYISFMLYPSHFYAGFEVPADSVRGLPRLFFPYESPERTQVVSAHPYEVVYRSLLSATDYLQKIDLSATGSARQQAVYGARLRPWLQDFSLRFDTNRGIIYDAEKVRLQIKAAEDAGASGWLLWNPDNVYTETAFTENVP